MSKNLYKDYYDAMNAPDADEWAHARAQSISEKIEREREYGHSEIPNTPEGLDEAAKAYALDTAEDTEQYSARYLGYKDGAKWQKEQDDKELSEKIAAAYQLGIKDKEQKSVEGLDEAAKEYAILPMDVGEGKVCIDRKAQAAFKAGAEWAFGQGETKEQEVFEADPKGVLSVPMILSSVDTFNVGDKVIVQIRKKED